jgi:N-acetyl-gamma-glutamyl-phosphate reductase
LSETTHFTWRNNNISTYKVFEHQHLNEIDETLESLQKNLPGIHFVPYRGNFSRGIYITTYTKTSLKIDHVKDMYAAYYKEHPFVHIIENTPDLKHVVNTNKCVLHLAKIGNQLVITSVIDNLLKGASGQAVQNMNLMFGLEETTGLKLKASAF